MLFECYIKILLGIIGIAMGYCLPVIILGCFQIPIGGFCDGESINQRKNTHYFPVLCLILGVLSIGRIIRIIVCPEQYSVFGWGERGIICGGKNGIAGWLDIFFQGWFMGSLWYSGETDFLYQVAYDVTWWSAMAAGVFRMILMLLFYSEIERSHRTLAISLFCLILFFFIQELMGPFCYGQADCYGFCGCAIQIFCANNGMTNVLVCMCVSYIFLFASELYKKNITNCGRLKTPAPFLHCITAAYLLL